MNILSLNYLGNVQYFSKLCFSDCVIDIHENYKKQSYRNRCEILTANGRISLIANVLNPGNYSRTSVKDVRLDYSKRWCRIHWQSLVSAYRNSPYFDFYAEHFEPFYNREFRFLFDLNAGLLETTAGLLGCAERIKYSEKYVDTHRQQGIGDYRDAISPKPRLSREDLHFTPEPYWQVFSDRFPFERNLSVIDLLLCEGPAAKEVLRSSFVP